MSQLILVGKSEAGRAYSQDFWGLEKLVTQTPGSYQCIELESAFPGPRENRPSGGALYYHIRY